VVTREAAVLAVAVVEGLTLDVVGLNVSNAGRDVEGPVAGLDEDKQSLVQLAHKRFGKKHFGTHSLC